MDIVYVLKKAPWDNIELRFSLRSLRNFEHDRVFIVGYKPHWIQNVIHIPATDGDNKLVNVMKKLRLICNDKRISDDFVLMNDDFYILNHIDEIPYYKLGTIKNHLAYRRERNPDTYASTLYYKAISLADEKFPKGDDFSVHCPIVYNKEKLLKMLDENDDSIISKRTLYCNTYGIKGIKLKNVPNYIGSDKITDCKIAHVEKFEILPGQPFLSTADEIGTSKEFRDFLNKMFFMQSPYEKKPSK